MADSINRYGRATGYIVASLTITWFAIGRIFGQAAKYPVVAAWIIGLTPSLLQVWFYDSFERNKTTIKHACLPSQFYECVDLDGWKVRVIPQKSSLELS